MVGMEQRKELELPTADLNVRRELQGLPQHYRAPDETERIQGALSANHCSTSLVTLILDIPQHLRELLPAPLPCCVSSP